MRFHIENMSCAGCAKSVAKIVATLDPRAKVEADLAAGTVTIASSAPRETIERALAGAGYPVRVG